MREIRFHGRGGQGAVTAAGLLAFSAAEEGMYVQAFPVFGVERRGAPVTAYLRTDREPIAVRSQIYSPDVVVVLDSTLLENVDVTAGLKKGGTLILNTPASPEEAGVPGMRTATLDATAIALRNGIGTRTSPIVNTAILGGCARALGDISLETLVDVVRREGPGDPEKNARAVREAYGSTVLGW